jgi:hypothetical protein
MGKWLNGEMVKKKVDREPLGFHSPAHLSVYPFSLFPFIPPYSL